MTMAEAHCTKPLLQQFLNHLIAERRVSPLTVEAYRRDISALFQHAKVAPEEITSQNINSLIAARLTSGASGQTARRQLSAIRSLFRFLLAEGLVSANPARHIRGAKAESKVVRNVTDAEIRKLLDAIPGSTALDLRDRALIHVAYGSGLRVSELLNLSVFDVDLQRGIAKVRRGKGQKDRIVPLNAHEVEALRDYISNGRAHLLNGENSDALFIGHRVTLSRVGIWQRLTRMSRTVLGRKVSPHKFRHAFVTETISGGADIRIVQRMAGHVSPNTTRRYLHHDFERIRSVYLKCHPRGN